MIKVRKRFPFFDSLRGFALVLMAIYHFCFDLNYFGVLKQSMNHDPFWLNFRAVIMSLFVGLAGVGFYIGGSQYRSRSFWKRLFLISACAIVISVTTYIQFGRTWTYFGVLHFIAVISLLSPRLILYPKVLLPIGLGIVLLPALYRNAEWSQFPLVLLGFSSVKPDTQDFVPFFPWLGVVFIGVFLGYLSLRANPSFLFWEMKSLSRLGRHSLLFYMTHQIVLFPFAWVIFKIFVFS